MQAGNPVEESTKAPAIGSYLHQEEIRYATLMSVSGHVICVCKKVSYVCDLDQLIAHIRWLLGLIRLHLYKNSTEQF